MAAPVAGMRLAGGERDFDGANELGGVVGVDEAGGGGIEARRGCDAAGPAR